MDLGCHSPVVFVMAFGASGGPAMVRGLCAKADAGMMRLATPRQRKAARKDFFSSFITPLQVFAGCIPPWTFGNAPDRTEDRFGPNGVTNSTEQASPGSCRRRVTSRSLVIPALGGHAVMDLFAGVRHYDPALMRKVHIRGAVLGARPCDGDLVPRLQRVLGPAIDAMHIAGAAEFRRPSFRFAVRVLRLENDEGMRVLELQLQYGS